MHGHMAGGGPVDGRRALATGFTVVGLGLGSFIMAPMATGLINHYGSALPVFRIVGIAMLIIVVIAALCLKVPPAGYKPAGWNPPAPAGGATAKATLVVSIALTLLIGGVLW